MMKNHKIKFFTTYLNYLVIILKQFIKILMTLIIII
jgi:hypothetical protein